MELSVKFVDDDHVWINNKQYISLKRFQHKIMYDVNDVISRKRAIDSFYGWKQENLFYHPNSKCKSIPFDEAIARIEEVPSAVETTMKLSSDTVEVVRCKDCKYRPVSYGDEHDLCFPEEYRCPCQCDDNWYSWMPKDDFFCARGERKTNG